MDITDIAIWCLLGNKYYEPPYASSRRPDPREVAKRLGLNQRTVKRRVQVMERNGFIRYYQLIPNYNLLGIKATALICYTEDVNKKYEVIEKIDRLMEGVLEIHNPVGPSFMIWVAYEDDLQKEKRFKLLEELSGTKPRELYDRDFPPIGGGLSYLDWQIMTSLRNDATKPITAISAELNVTRKTVRKRLDSLVRNKAFLIRAVFDPSRVTGIQLCQLCVYLDNKQETRERVLRELDSRFKENIFLKMVAVRGEGVLLGLYSIKVGEPEDYLITAKGIKGVVDAELRILKEVREYPEPIDARIKEKMKLLARRPQHHRPPLR